MGKIKKTILAKQDRPRTEPKPPSMRRVKRMNKTSIESSRAGRNSTFTPSRIVSLRGLRRREKDFAAPSGTFAQAMPKMVLFRFKKRKRPVVEVMHEGGGIRKPKTSNKQIKVLTCKPDDSVRIAQFELMVKQGLGKIEHKDGKVIRHRIDKQDKYFKFHNHDVKY
jgi:hypothetical protein